jgi:hypothetical protein
VHLDVVDAAGAELSSADIVKGLLHTVTASTAAATATMSSLSSSDIGSAAAVAAPPRNFAVYRNKVFRYRTRRPRRVFTQFSGNVGSVVLEAARNFAPFCDACDLNFGTA